MKAILSISIFVFASFYFVACGSDEQNGTNQNSPNTLESLLNPNANSATATSTVTKVSSGSLQDTWVLARIGGTVDYEVNLANNIPILTLDTVANTMSGHTGCNSIGGKLNARGNKLSFNGVELTSKQPCSDKGFEKKMVSSFKSGNMTYRLANDTLYLNVGGGTEFIYRRISRG